MKFALTYFKHLTLLVLLVVVVLIAQQWQPATQSLGERPLEIQSAQLTSHAQADQVKTVVVNLKLRNRQELERLLRDQCNPRSPRYQRYLTPHEFQARFAPSLEESGEVADYLRRCGLTDVKIAPNRLLVSARGSISQLESTFSVTINCYRERLGRRSFISNNLAPRVPVKLHSVVDSVVGLSNFGCPLEPGPGGVTDELQFQPKEPGQVEQRPPLGMSPQTIATAYNFPNVNNSRAGTKYSGAGRSLAIATAFAYDHQDVETYWSRFGIKRSGQVFDIAVGGNTTVTHKETTLDLQQAGAQVPGADILMYMGVDGDSTTFELVFNQIVIDNRADVVSMSWGVCEESLGTKYMNPLNAILLQARAQGMAVFCSSGDRGAYDYDANSTKMAAHYVASDPNVVAVGGTTLLPDRQPRREIAWSGSGGGASDYWRQPEWQIGPGVPANGKRNTPDVALNANPFRSGYAAYFRGRWLVTGGTSLATPNWAALWLLADEAAGKRIGDANQKLYFIGGKPELYAQFFVDIVEGNNGDERGPGYKALPGWDHTTGWGVPNGAALVEWLRKQAAAQPPPVVSPSPPPPLPDPSPPATSPAPEPSASPPAADAPGATADHIGSPSPVAPVVPSPQPSP